MKPGDVATDHRRLAEASREPRCFKDRVLRRPVADDDLNERHHRGRVEEVQTDDTIRVAARVADVRDAQRTGVGGQDVCDWSR